MPPDDWAIFDRCGDELARWADRERQKRSRAPQPTKPRHPVADAPPRSVSDGPPTSGWPDDDPDPSDSGRFGPN